MMKNLYDSIQAIINLFIDTINFDAISVRRQKKERISKNIWTDFIFKCKRALSSIMNVDDIQVDINKITKRLHYIQRSELRLVCALFSSGVIQS